MTSINLKKIRTVILFLFIAGNFSVYGSDNNLFTPTDTTKSSRKPWDKFSVSLGGFLANYNSGLTLGSNHLGVGLVLNLESALDLDISAWALRNKINYRFGKTQRHGINFGYFQINRTAFKKLGADLEIGDVVIPLGTEITSKFNFTIFRAKYDYSFFQDDRVSLGASFGFFIMPISFSVNVKDQTSSSTEMLAPLPVIGLRSDFLITNKIYYRQSIELLYLSFEGFTGSVLDLDLSLEYRPLKHFGFGLGINSTKLEITSEGESYPNLDFYGELTSSYVGVYLFGKYAL